MEFNEIKIGDTVCTTDEYKKVLTTPFMGAVTKIEKRTDKNTIATVECLFTKATKVVSLGWLEKCDLTKEKLNDYKAELELIRQSRGELDNMVGSLIDNIKEKCEKGLVVNIPGYLNSPLEIYKANKSALHFLMKRTCYNCTWLSFKLTPTKKGLNMHIDNWFYYDKEYIMNDFRLARELARLFRIPVTLSGYTFMSDNHYDIDGIYNNHYKKVLKPRLNEQMLDDNKDRELRVRGANFGSYYR